VHAGRASDLHRPGDQSRAGRAVADERLRAALPNRACGRHDRGLRCVAHGGDRIWILRNRYRGIDDRDAADGLAKLAGRPEQQDLDSLLRGDPRPRGDLTRPEIGAVGVDRDDRHV